MRIAVASSGLGHVARGIETWARDTADALAEHGADVTLFAAGPTERGEGLRETARNPVPASIALASLRRGDSQAVRLTRRSPGWAWRWQLKSAYGWEQLSFWRHLWPHLRRGQFDILHVQDPMLAYWCRLFRKAGLVGSKEILAHGTEETAEFLRRFEYVQHLAPWHLETAEESERKHWKAIPNFVDTEIFSPASASSSEFRVRHGIPADAFVVGTVAAVKKHHKRVDYLVREFAAFAEPERPSPYLLIAGASTSQSEELIRLAEERAPGRVKFLLDRPREEMPELYRAMDLFVLASQFEMMPIAVLEALASGVPLAVNRHPVLEWMVGVRDDEPVCGGAALAMEQDGALCSFLQELNPAWMASRARGARKRAETRFAKPVVIRQYIEYYQQVLGQGTM